MNPKAARRWPGVFALSSIIVLAGCGNSSGTSDATETTAASASAPTAAASETLPVGTNTGAALVASAEVPVVFDTPGADPRPLREVPVTIDAPTNELRMKVTDLTYRGIVCGFTFAGTRPTSPVTITVSGATKATTFTSGAVNVSWSDEGQATADSPQGDNGWNFSADATPNRNGAGWSVSIGAVTGDGPDTVPTDATCTLKSATPFEPANGPVGYWAGFATR